MLTYETKEIAIGQNKGAPRVWLEGKRIEGAGFTPGAKYELVIQEKRVTLTVNPDGSRVVSAKQRKDCAIPVIDINSAQALAIFAGLDRVRVIIRKDEIHLLPLATQAKAKERLDRIKGKLASGQPLRMGSLCHGGGILSLALHEGLEAAGISSTLAFANDLEPEVLFHAAEHNPAWTSRTQAIAAPMQEVVADDWLLKQLGPVDVLEAGIPCVAASLAGRAKKGLSMAEADENAGHLVVPFLGIIERLQPAIVVVENVPPYQLTASAHLLRHTLRDWGYTVTETVLAATDFGAMEDRKRMAMVAVTAGLSFDIQSVEPTGTSTRSIADILDPVAVDDPMWATMQYLADKQARDIAAGKGFRTQVIAPTDTRVGTIGRDYMKRRSTEPMLGHPTDANLKRLFTPREHARLKGVPEALIDDLPATRAHALLGNSICMAPFRALGTALGRALHAGPTPAHALASAA